MDFGSFIVAILMLMPAFANCTDKNLKSKFGEEFGVALRKYNADFIKTSLNQKAEAYETILRDIKPTSKDEQKFKMRLETIKRIKTEVGDKLTGELRNEFKNLSQTVQFELIFYRSDSIVTADMKKTKIMIETLKKIVAADKEDLKDFQTKIVNKWREVYQKIPAEELKNHKEYAEINERMEDLIQKEKIDSAQYLQNLINHENTLRYLGQFFGYHEYES